MNRAELDVLLAMVQIMREQFQNGELPRQRHLYFRSVQRQVPCD